MEDCMIQQISFSKETIETLLKFPHLFEEDEYDQIVFASQYNRDEKTLEENRVTLVDTPKGFVSAPNQ